MTIRCKGLLIVLSSPSGAGKTSLVRALMADDKRLALSVSVTTRPKRPLEVDGVDYQFVDDRAFDQYVDQSAFLEHAQVFGHRYGTLKNPIETNQNNSIDTLFDIDWQGTQQLSQKVSLVRIFILPPSLSSLEARLRSRKQDSDETIHQRMQLAASEMSHWAEYDYVIVNDNFDKALENIQSIIEAERLRREHQIDLDAFVKELYVQKTSVH